MRPKLQISVTSMTKLVVKYLILVVGMLLSKKTQTIAEVASAPGSYKKGFSK